MKHRIWSVAALSAAMLAAGPAAAQGNPPAGAAPGIPAGSLIPGQPTVGFPRMGPSLDPSAPPVLLGRSGNAFAGARRLAAARDPFAGISVETIPVIAANGTRGTVRVLTPRMMRGIGTGRFMPGAGLTGPFPVLNQRPTAAPVHWIRTPFPVLQPVPGAFNPGAHLANGVRARFAAIRRPGLNMSPIPLQHARRIGFVGPYGQGFTQGDPFSGRDIRFLAPGR